MQPIDIVRNVLCFADCEHEMRSITQLCGHCEILRILLALSRISNCWYPSKTKYSNQNNGTGKRFIVIGNFFVPQTT